MEQSLESNKKMSVAFINLPLSISMKRLVLDLEVINKEFELFMIEWFKK